MTDELIRDFSQLSPDIVIDALEAQNYCADGRILALNSYENRVYQIYLEQGQILIAKFYRPGRWTDEAILEEHQFTRELAEVEIPVVSPIVNQAGDSLHHFQGYRFALFPRQQGRTPEICDFDTLSWMGRYLGRIHQMSRREAFLTRPSIDLASYGYKSRDYLLEHQLVPTHLQKDYFTILELALAGVAECYKSAGQLNLLRAHGDCHWGNILWSDSSTGAGPWFVDFDDARNAPAIQDIWMLLSGSRSEMQAQLISIIDAYSDFMEFDQRELALIEALRTLRLVHYSAWLAQRWSDPAFPIAFPWFASDTYWLERTQELREQIELMQQAPILI